MVITKEVKIKLTGRIKNYYDSIGYTKNEDGYYYIKIEDLTKNSNVKVDVTCDICGNNKTLKYQNYNRSFNNDVYCCIDCKSYTYKLTCLKKYGVENTFQLQEIKDKSNKTKLEKYGEQNYNNREKCSETCLEKYGVDNVMKSEIVKDKNRETCIEKYGFTTASQNQVVKDKMKKTNLKKWKSSCTLHSFLLKDKIKQIFINKYGVDNPMKDINIWGRAQHTSLRRLLYKDTDLLYQGKYEKDFLDNFLDKVEIKNGMSLKYMFNKKECMYHSDFYLPTLNLIVEIKSSYWYEGFLEKNIAKEKQCIEDGYNFLFIIDKDYEKINNILNERKNKKD